MYHHITEAFGDYLKHTLVDSKGGNSISLIPECGALLISCVMDGTELLDGYRNPSELEELAYGKSLLLFPFPNRLDSGSYWLDGKNYQFPVNDPHTGNAIHGLGFRTPFKIHALQVENDYASITCSHDYNGRNPAFPFPFCIKVKFTINATELNVQLTMENTGIGSIPAGLGWHPYFFISENMRNCTLQMPELERIEIDDRMIPTGNREKIITFTNPVPLANVRLDNCFFIVNQQKPFVAVLDAPSGKLTYTQETGPDKFNYVQIFTPDHKRSIALEPMTCNINAFNNGEGLKILQPGEQFGGQCSIRFAKNFR